MNWTAFLSYSLVCIFTPGPNNIMALSNATRYGFWKAMPHRLGVLTGFFVAMLCCALFSAALKLYVPIIMPYMLALGAAYILWLAWKIFSAPAEEIETGKGADNHFMTGVLMQAFNVKVLLMGVTVMTTFILPCTSNLAALTGFSFGLAVASFISTCCWGLFGSFFSVMLCRHGKFLNTVMALLLVYCAVSLFL